MYVLKEVKTQKKKEEEEEDEESGIRFSYR